jgi:hypothetical protein
MLVAEHLQSLAANGSCDSSQMKIQQTIENSSDYSHPMHQIQLKHILRTSFASK